LAELYSGAAPFAHEVKELAEIVDTARRRAGTKTLRDEYAMVALTGLVTRDSARDGRRSDIESDAVLAYRYADAMMAERGK
jgi:hypothetical protein